MVKYLTKGSRTIQTESKLNLGILRRRKSQLRSKESSVRAEVDHESERVSQSKATVLMEEMLQNIWYPDAKVASELREGFQMVGEMRSSGVFQTKPPEEVNQGADPQWLERMAEELRAELIYINKNNKGDDLDKAVYNITCQGEGSETHRGWASGPFSEKEISDRVGTDKWVPAKRFGIQQGEKVRQIDDFTRFFTNACTTVKEKVALDTIDDIIAGGKTWLHFIDTGRNQQGKFSVRWEGGTVTHHVLHEEWMTGEIEMAGTCLDLEAAYKQCPVRADQRKFTVFGVVNPQTKETEFFVANSLPFGQVSSVHSFNRVSRALNYLMHEYGYATPTNFVDDFTLLAPTQVANIQYANFIELADILGWTLKAKTLVPPASVFPCLGVRIDLGWIHTAGFIIRNKTERIMQITQDLEEIIQKQTVSAAQASVLKGRMSFSNSQTYSRVGVVGFKCLEKRSNHATIGKLREDECRAITWWIEAITQLPPRSIPYKHPFKVVLIFHDGACEDEGRDVGYGGFLLDLENSQTEAFAATMGPELRDILSDGGRKRQIIGQAEIYPALVAKKLWEDRLRHRCINHYFDNDSARFALMRGNSPTSASAWMIHHFWKSEATGQSRSWLSRAPSVSNIGDAPSRKDTEEIARLYPGTIWKQWTRADEARDVRAWGAL